jgi:hypothetical protein
MLIALGVRAIARPFRDRAHAHAHPVDPPRLAARSLAIGLIHGLAGSGALTALVMAELPSTPSRLVYIALFGCGSMLGMALLSGLAGWPLARVGYSRRVAASIALITGAFSIALGLTIGVRMVVKTNAPPVSVLRTRRGQPSPGPALLHVYRVS